MKLRFVFYLFLLLVVSISKPSTSSASHVTANSTNNSITTVTLLTEEDNLTLETPQTEAIFEAYKIMARCNPTARNKLTCTFEDKDTKNAWAGTIEWIQKPFEVTVIVKSYGIKIMKPQTFFQAFLDAIGNKTQLYSPSACSVDGE